MAYVSARMLKSRRCFYYRDDGSPYLRLDGGRGCRKHPSSHCTYAHPDDPQWQFATSSLYPPHDVHLHTPKMTGNMPLPPPPAPMSARPPSPFGPPPPPPPGGPRERVPSMSSAHGYDRDVDMRAPHGRGHSPARSIASSSGRRLSYVASGAREREDRDRDDDRGRYREEDKRGRGNDKRYEDRSRDKRRDDDRYRDDEYRRDARRRDERSRERRSRSSSRPRRSSPSHRATKSSPDKPVPPPKELTAEEKRKLWLDRIKLLSQTVQARSAHLRLHDELQNYEKLAKSAQYENLPEEDKAAIQNLISSAFSRFREKQQELNRLAGQLIPDDFWPFAQQAQQTSDPVYHQILGTLSTLKEEVEGLHGALSSAQPLQPSTTASATASGSTAAPAAAMKPEPGEISTDAPSRPNKRRRLSVDVGVQIAEISAKEMESMQDQLTALAHNLSDLQNDLHQYDRKVADEVEAQLDYKMAGLRLGVGGEGDRPADPELQEKVEKLSEATRLVQEQAAQANQTLAGIRSDIQSQDQEHARLQLEHDATRKALEEMQAQQVQMDELSAAYRTQADALTEALKAVTAQGVHPPLPPAPLTADAIVEAIRPRLLNAARDDIVPILEGVRAHIQKELQEQSSIVSGELMTQMSPVVRSVEWITAWISRIQGANSATVTTTTGGNTTTSADKGKGVAR